MPGGARDGSEAQFKEQQENKAEDKGIDVGGRSLAADGGFPADQ